MINEMEEEERQHLSCFSSAFSSDHQQRKGRATKLGRSCEAIINECAIQNQKMNGRHLSSFRCALSSDYQSETKKEQD